MKSLYWISFSLDGRFNGACIVEEASASGACVRARTLGIRPAGEALALRVDPAASNPESLAKLRAHRDVLLTPADCEAIFGRLHTSVESHGDLLYGADDLSKPS